MNMSGLFFVSLVVIADRMSHFSIICLKEDTDSLNFQRKPNNGYNMSISYVEKHLLSTRNIELYIFRNFITMGITKARAGAT